MSLIKPINIIKIKNKTKTKYDIENIAKQISLRGIFAKKILETIENATTEEEKEKLLNSFEIGMDVLK